MSQTDMVNVVSKINSDFYDDTFEIPDADDIQ